MARHNDALITQYPHLEWRKGTDWTPPAEPGNTATE